MGEEGGTGLSARGDYVSNLIMQSFTAIAGVLSMHTTLQTLLGATRRVTDLLLVCAEIKAERTAAAAPQHSGDQGSNSCIRLDGVDVVAPDGATLAQGLSLCLQSRAGSGSTSSSLLVTGATGCGKSSVFRVLAGIWLPQQGVVHVPSEAVFVPQQPLATTVSVSLLTYLTYPNQLKKGKEADSATSVLSLYLQEVGVVYLVERYGWNSKRHWGDVLSLGEQQCLACIRMIFHLHPENLETTPPADRRQQDSCSRDVPGRQLVVGPKWAVMDECTSALAGDKEAKIYRLADRCKINRLTFALHTQATGE